MPRPKSLTIRYRPLDEIEPADVNPKRHTVEDIADAIERHGFVDPQLIDTRTGKLLGGEGRLKALRWLFERGRPAPKYIRAVGPTDMRASGEVADRAFWRVPTLETETPNDVEAGNLLVALNSLEEKGGWDQDQLARLLDELRQHPAGLEGTGYDDAAVDKLLVDIAGDAPTEPAEGGTEPALNEAVTFRVVVECSGEAIQASLAEELEGRGYTVTLQTA